MDSPLLVKSKQFALDIIKVCNQVKSEKRESILINQLVRIIASGFYDDKMMHENCIELKNLLISSINTAKKNKKKIAYILFYVTM